MAAQHTPGPWKIVGANSDGDRVISKATYDTIAPLFAPEWGTIDDPAIQRANARLIAAAPELLAALKGVLAVADRKTTEFDAARAAIVKAEGQS